MKVAQVIRRFTFSEWGGTENVVWNSSRVLVELGVSTEILATQALNSTSQEVVEELTIRRFPYFYPYFPLFNPQRLALDKKGGNPLVPSLEKYLVRAKFDLLHCHNLGRMAELTARAAERLQAPYVLSLHGGCLEVPGQERRELLRPLRHTLSYGGIWERLFHLRRDVLQNAAGIICVGENEYELFQKKFPNKKILYLPNGVSPEKYALPVEFSWRKELNLAADCELILNVSRLDYQKNQLLLLKLAVKLREAGKKFHLLLIGPVSSQWYYDELQKFILANNLGDFVTIIPGLKPDDSKLTAAYQQADLFILPSAHEPFGIVVLEAWSAKLPVVTSDVGGLGRLVTDRV
ncbi:MAG: glycosyltransferase family 4 protein, partial [Victivallaceae bacterium]